MVIIFLSLRHRDEHLSFGECTLRHFQWRACLLGALGWAYPMEGTLDWLSPTFCRSLFCGYGFVQPSEHQRLCHRYPNSSPNQ